MHARLLFGPRCGELEGLTYKTWTRVIAERVLGIMICHICSEVERSSSYSLVSARFTPHS